MYKSQMYLYEYVYIYIYHIVYVIDLFHVYIGLSYVVAIHTPYHQAIHGHRHGCRGTVTEPMSNSREHRLGGCEPMN